MGSLHLAKVILEAVLEDGLEDQLRAQVGKCREAVRCPGERDGSITVIFVRTLIPSSQDRGGRNHL